MSRLPVPELLVPLAGVVMVTGRAMVILGLWADLGALLLAAFSLAVAPVHAFWREEDQWARLIQVWGTWARTWAWRREHTDRLLRVPGVP